LNKKKYISKSYFFNQINKLYKTVWKIILYLVELDHLVKN
jgi:hypothetical protein